MNNLLRLACILHHKPYHQSHCTGDKKADSHACTFITHWSSLKNGQTQTNRSSERNVQCHCLRHFHQVLSRQRKFKLVVWWRFLRNEGTVDEVRARGDRVKKFFNHTSTLNALQVVSFFNVLPQTSSSWTKCSMQWLCLLKQMALVEYVAFLTRRVINRFFLI